MKKLKSLNMNLMLTVIFFAALIWYFLNNHEELKQLLSVPVSAIVTITLLKILGIFANGFFTKFILDAFNKKISVKETSYLAWLTSVGNFFGPILGGASIRAVYLKKKFDFEYSKFISTLYGIYIITFFVSSIVGIACVILLTYTTGMEVDRYRALIVFVSIAFLNFCLMIIPSKYVKNIVSKISWIPKRIVNMLNLMIDGWETIRQNRSLLIKLSILYLITFAIAVAQTYILYGLFVDSYSIINVLLYTVLGSLALLVSLTPGAIGIKEGILLFFTQAIALDSAQVLQIATIDRSISFLILFLSFFSIKLFKLDKNLMNFKAKS